MRLDYKGKHLFAFSDTHGKEGNAKKSGAQSLAMSPPFRHFAKQMVNSSYCVFRFGL